MKTCLRYAFIFSRSFGIAAVQQLPNEITELQASLGPSGQGSAYMNALLNCVVLVRGVSKPFPMHNPTVHRPIMMIITSLKKG